MKKADFINNLNDENSKKIPTFSPKKPSDAEAIINCVKSGPALISLKAASSTNAQRILDLLCGAVYALNAKICPLDTENYLIAK